MSVREDPAQVVILLHSFCRRNQMHNLGLSSAVPIDKSLVDGIQHGRPGSEIEWDVIPDVIPWSQRNPAIEAPFFDMFVTNPHAVLFLSFAIAQKSGVGDYPD